LYLYRLLTGIWKRVGNVQTSIPGWETRRVRGYTM